MLECKNIGSNVNHIKKMIVSQYEKWRIGYPAQNLPRQSN